MTAAPARFPGRAPIDAYGNGGFRFAGMSHRGSILCLPSGIYAWSPADPLDRSSLSSALAEKDAMQLLILGTGAQHTEPSATVKRVFADAGIGLEVMNTGAACRTYNVLLGERRAVGAALVAVP